MASTIDDLLDQGVTAYFNATESHVNAIALWQQAQIRAQAIGDLIREANALSNMGCASRVMGRFSASLSYLALAWQKSCAFVQLVAQQDIFSPEQLIGVDLIQMSLTTELVAIEKGANFHFNASDAASHVPPSDWGYALGPPIAMWFMRLLVNIGHANLAVGRVDLACEWYNACIQLCENTILKHPIPEVLSADSKIVLLSHVHRVTLLTKVRALTHRGVCYTSMGMVQEGIQSQIVALDLLTEHGSTLGEPERTYRAAIEANLGNIHHARGRLTAAVAHHARSAMLFLQAEDLSAHARELGNLGALWIEIGKSLRELEWVRSADPAFTMVLEQSTASQSSNDDKAKNVLEHAPRSQSVKRKRTVTANDVSKYPGKYFTVARQHQPRPNADLDMPLNVNDKVSVIMLMDDGSSALGQKEGGWQGTFPLECLEIEEAVAIGSSMASDEIHLFSDMLTKVSDLKDIFASSGNESIQASLKKNPVLETYGGIHCGTSYVEFGLGILRDVVNLGAQTPEVAVNIGKWELFS
jgi:tetratricopeptide (TPR) repeat protein